MKTTRRKFIKSLGLSTTALSVPGLISFSCMKKRRPNIIFIMSDDHAEQAISCYGSNLIKTPNIDRIANGGIRFDNSFVTNSICAPSRAVLLTGKYSHINGLRDNQDEFDGSQLTFPKLLQTARYQTAIVGKWDLKTEPTGFNISKVLKGQGQYYNPTFDENGEKKEYTGYITDLITDKAIETMDHLDKSNPFCLLVHHKAPHRNWMPNIKHLNTFTDIELPFPETFNDDYTGREAAKIADMRIDDMYLSFDLKLHKDFYVKETSSGGKASFAENVIETWEKTYNRLTDEQKTVWDAHYDKINEEFKNLNLSGDKLLNWKYQQYIKDYLRCILSLDENVGRLLNYLDENGLTENTIVVYTSDQGFYLGEHGWYDKRFMYEESLSMPLVMRYPDEIQAGKVSQKMVMNLDFASTFLDFAGVEIPKEMQGESLRSIVKGNSPDDWRESIYYHYYEYPHGWHNVKRHCGVRTEQYKLIHFYQDDIWELFDLEKDPNEVNNIYTNPEYSNIVVDLKKELKRLQQMYGDTDFE
jgi:arylsulfatase A-like enzyme